MGRTESAGYDEGAVEAVLVGDAAYDDLTDAAQAVVRAAWDARIAARRAGLDYVAEFRARGWTPWSEADAQGNT